MLAENFGKKIKITLQKQARIIIPGSHQYYGLESNSLAII